VTTNSERVAKARKALVDRGGRRIPTGYFQPAEAKALAYLVESGYAVSPVHAICRALIEAEKKVRG